MLIVQTFEASHANQHKIQRTGSVEAMRGHSVIEADTYRKRIRATLDLHLNGAK
jgi:hypothetical protein